VAAILAQIESVSREPIDSEELEQAKRQKSAEHVFSLQTAERIAENMARDYQSTGDIHFSRSYTENIQKVTAEQVRDAARRYLVPQRMARIQVLPEVPTTSTAPAVDEAGPAPVRRITLDNGSRCLIQPDPTAPLVAIQSFSLGGVLFEDEQTNGLSQLVAQVAPRGTQNRSAEQIARFFDSRGGTFGGQSGNNTVYFAAQVLKEDFVDALEVVADVVCNPTFPADELDRHRPIVLDAIRRIDETWRSELMAYLDRRAFTHSPYRLQAAGSLDVVSKATREDLAAFYRRQVTGPNTVVAVFGDIDPQAAETLLRRHFGALSAGKVPLPSVAAEPDRDKPAVYIKAKPPTRDVAGLGLSFTGMPLSRVDDVARMAVLDTIISGYRYPTGWLEESLRGKDRSLVYEIHAIHRPGPIPGCFQIYAACEPEKVSEVYTIIMRQLDRARAGEFTPAELERAKTIIATTEMMSHQTNAERAMQAALDELYGLGFDNNRLFLDRVKAVTLDQVRETAARYLTVPVVAVVTPAPDAVRLGIEPTAVDRDDSIADPAEKGKP
ncbi:MAG TPA: insulinase family protein, partial [Phycisphaerae bacterium]|nr:insulinase family protein [Phycisphaerae bacterium]